MRFHHVGIACADLKEARSWVKATHPIVEETGPVADPLQNASFITLRTKDGLLIELIAGAQVANILKKGVNLYHLCYELPDLDAALKTFTAQGSIVISAPKPSVLFHGRRIAFLNTPLGIIELLEE